MEDRTDDELLLNRAFGEIGIKVYRLIDGNATRDELEKKAGIHKSVFERILDFLEARKMIKLVDGKPVKVSMEERENTENEVMKRFGVMALRIYRMVGIKSTEEIRERLGVSREELLKTIITLEKKGFLRKGSAEVVEGSRRKILEPLETGPIYLVEESEYSKLINLGNECYEIERYSTAKKYYEQAIKIANDRWVGYYNHALAAYKRGEWKEALSDLLVVEVLDSKRFETYLLKGKIYYKKQEFENSIKMNNKAIELEPNDYRAYYNKALVYGSMEEYTAAIKDSSKAIELKPDFAKAWYLRGLAYEYAGRLDEAMRDYEKALELNPEMIEAKAHLEAAKAKKEQTAGKEKLKKYKDKDGLIEVNIETPKVNFQNIAGMSRWKKRMELEVIQPLKNRRLAEKYGIKGGNILLYGPPGCGKSLIAEAIAGELGTKVIKVDIAEILSMYVGNAEKNMKAIFEKAEENQPCILIFDELEGLGGIRESRICNVGLVDQFVKELDEIKKKKLDVLVIGTTNMPWMVDSAVARRFSGIVYIPEPDEETRKELFKYYTKNLPVEGLDFEELARKTEGMASSNIENICKKAALFAYRDALEGREREIRMEDFKEALKEERSAVQLWKEQSKNYVIGPMFKELGLREERKEKKEEGMYG